MAAQTYNIPDAISGDTFAGVQFTLTVNSSPLDLTGAVVIMTVRQRTIKNTVYYEFTNGSGITLTTPASGIFTLDEQVINIPEGNYKYDITIHLPNAGTVKTYIKGEWTILENV